MTDTGDLDVTPAGAGDDAEPEFAVTAGAPTIAWVGAWALAAIGVVAAVVIGGTVGLAALAVGVVALAATVLVELFKSDISPVVGASRAAWCLWSAARYTLQGELGKAWSDLRRAKLLDWFWLAALATLTVIALRRYVQHKRGKNGGK